MLILFLVHEKKNRGWPCIGFWVQTQTGCCDLPVWHPTHFSSRRDREVHAVAVTQILDAQTLTLCQLKHLELLQPVSSHQKHWQYPLSSINAWTRLPFSVFSLNARSLHLDEWTLTSERTAAACGALSCPTTCPLLHPGEQEPGSQPQSLSER